MDYVERKDTLKLTFNPNYARPKSFAVELFLRDVMKITIDDMIGIYLSLVSSTVYVKLISVDKCEELVRSFDGVLKFKHSDGNIGDVRISHAGMGVKTLRIFELPFEVTADQINAKLKDYGTVISNVAEKWSGAHIFPVLNGIRQVKIELTKHVPSYLSICGYRAIIMYDGQPRTCSGCGSTGHVRAQCLQRRVAQIPTGERSDIGPMSTLPVTYVAAARAHIVSEPDLDSAMEVYNDLPDETTADTSRTAQSPLVDDTREVDGRTLSEQGECSNMGVGPQAPSVEGTPTVDVDVVPEGITQPQDEATSPTKKKKRRIAHQGAAETAPLLREKAALLRDTISDLTQPTSSGQPQTKKKTRLEDSDTGHGTSMPDAAMVATEVEQTDIPPPHAASNRDLRTVQQSRDWADETDDDPRDEEMRDTQDRASVVSAAPRTADCVQRPVTATSASALDDDQEFY